MFNTAFLTAVSQAAYDAGFRDGLNAADDAASSAFDAARAVVHSAAGGERHPFWETLDADPVNDPWHEVGAALDDVRQARRDAIRKSLGGVA